MVSILLTLNALICIALIIIILLQRSDPASGGMFGGTGGGVQPVVRNPLARPTAILAALFLIFSVLAAYLNKGAGEGESIMEHHAAPAIQPAQLPEAALLPTAPQPASPTVVSPTANPSTSQPE